MLLDEGDQVSCIHELTKLARALSHVEHHKSAEQWSIELHHDVRAVRLQRGTASWTNPTWSSQFSATHVTPQGVRALTPSLTSSPRTQLAGSAYDCIWTPIILHTLCLLHFVSRAVTHYPRTRTVSRRSR